MRAHGKNLTALTLIAFSLSACGAGGGSGGPTVSGATAGSTTVVPAVSSASPGGASAVQVAVSPTPASAAVAKSTAVPTPIKPASPQPSAANGIKRSGFLGAFFRPVGPPPYGIFSAQSPGLSPQPYPSPGSPGYCTNVAANGVSIITGNLVDSTKLNDMLNLGVRWLRMQAPAYSDDLTHVYGPGQYFFGDLDSAQCNTLVNHGIRPVIGLEAGPVLYSSVIGQLPAQTLPTYQSAADFGTWCDAVASHELSAFPSVTQFSLPGNEVNSNAQMFPGGEAQIAAYSEICYRAIKAANPSAFVYGFELNMIASLDAPAFVSQMAALGCKIGTCYDGLAIHLTLQYPIPPAGTPCFPNPGGEYSMQCIADIQTAARAPIHILISENVYTVPASVADESTKALAVLAEFPTFAANSSVDGVSYANVDECGLYPTGYFSGGCLINTSGQILPGYSALQQLATSNYQ
jgi:hypothetical protein